MGRPKVRVCFFRQFIRSVLKVDYLTLRHGFVVVSSPYLYSYFWLSFILLVVNLLVGTKL
ncbi:MLO-like protein 6 [Impatiens glandulifera]|uniref:MLO-like protein 6 n=1 Tax=Impatiens glandulifera TaxID=253017 RepID=UPI001FB16CDF|nr:MLO-like protein 6 [Impatiens glandulifera]